MRFQHQLSNGTWFDTEPQYIERYVARAVARDAYFAQREQRAQMTADDVLTALTAGKVLPHDTDWYAKIRDADARKMQPVAHLTQTRCDCGHSATHPMTTRRGTACPDCYDRLSE